MRGIDDAAVQTIVAADIAALVTEHDARPDANLAAIRAHNAVVTAAMNEHSSPVPVRFGQWLASGDEVRSALEAGAARWHALLEKFAGCAEFAIRVFDPEIQPSAEGPLPKNGREYMAALKARVSGPAARHAAAVAPLEDALRGLVAGLIVDPLRTQHGVATVACLVHRANFNAYQTTVERVRTSLPHFRYLSTGPWPPYSFVTE